MTASPTAVVAGGPPARRVGSRRVGGRRWLRLAIPFLVLTAFWAITVIAHSMQQPNLDDPGTLSPTGTGPDGSSELSAHLAAEGVTVERVTSSAAAIRAAVGVDATIFVPTPDFLAPAALHALRLSPGQHRVVVVKPSIQAVVLQSLPIVPVGERWATGVATTRCADGHMALLGPATVRRTVYVPSTDPSRVTTNCYGGAILGIKDQDVELVVVGATEPFRNSRIDEVHNAALGSALLREHRHVIWLDIHEPEPFDQLKPPSPRLPDYSRDDQKRGGTGNPIIDAFPSGLWAIIVLGITGAALLALAQARRLGGPSSRAVAGCRAGRGGGDRPRPALPTHPRAPDHTGRPALVRHPAHRPGPEPVWSADPIIGRGRFPDRAADRRVRIRSRPNPVRSRAG